MFATKFYVDTNRNNMLMLRITNNRKKAELALGFRISEEELTDILSGSPSQKNRQLASLVFIWQGKIEAIKLDLLKDMNATQDPKEIKNIVQTTLFGKKEPATTSVVVGKPRLG